jgi:thiamine pyrophosphate-dependent acetolactate synthase large subunit-like protein
VTEPMRNGGAALVAALERNGVEVVFGIPGVHNLEIYRHLDGSPIRHVAVRHEQGAGYAADGYARASGAPGVCLTTSGPALTNVCTAAATAYADSVPVLVVSPGPSLGLERRDLGLLHEVKDQQGHMEALLTASVRPTSAQEILDVVDEAFDGWQRARPRPVHVEVPIDVLDGPWESGAVRGPGLSEVDRLRAVLDSMAPPESNLATAHLDAAARALADAQRPLFVLGGGAGGAAESARLLAERVGALVVTTVNGKGVLSERHPLSLGASIRLRGTRWLFESADVVVVAGSELGSSDLWDVALRTEGHVVRIDVDPHQLQKNLAATEGICMDAAQAFDGLLARLGTETPGRNSGRPVWTGAAATLREKLLDEARSDGARYERINSALSDALPGSTVVAGDSAQVSYFGTAHFWPMDRPGRFLYPTGYSTLGYGLPAAIGAKLSCPDDPVVVLVGDGGFLFTVQELLTAVEQRLALPVVIADNHGYSEIREGMEERGIRPFAVDRPPVDFGALSQAFGGAGRAVASIDELCEGVRTALGSAGPTVLTIDVSEGAPR